MNRVMKELLNDLERAFVAAARGPEGRPEFFRQLRDSQLSFLTSSNYGGQTTRTTSSSGSLSFQVWAKKKEACIPIFTSVERVEQALKKTGRQFNRQNVFQMKGDKLFQAITARKPPIGVIINPGCDTGEMFLDATAVKLLANGAILKPLRPEKRESGMVHIVEPSDYPTQLVNSLFQYFRRYGTVRAAWLFRHQPEPSSAEPTYIVGLVLTNADGARRIEQDLTVVAKGIRPIVKCSATVLDLTDPAVAKTVANHMPFYSVPDFERDRKVLRMSTAAGGAIGRIVAVICRPIAQVIRRIRR